MSSEEVIVGVVVGTVVGIVAAGIGARAALKAKEMLTEEDIQELKDSFHRAGWKQASNDATNIRKRYQEMFGNPEEEEG